MNAQHTPGPWKAVRNHPDPETAKHYIEVVPETGGAFGEWSSQSICGLFCAKAGGIQEANARLIASAPDLLAALEKCVASIEDGIESDGKMEHEWSRVDRELCKVARAAIAKAKGEA